MSLTLKVGSLVIRTLAKPIAVREQSIESPHIKDAPNDVCSCVLQNQIKHRAREHERFRSIAISFAQRLHRIDMRLRLGLLQDPAAIDRQIAREVKEAEARAAKAKKDAEIPTVKTLEQTQAEKEELKKTKEEVTKRVEEREKQKPKPRIRPLSEAKAIETGANFISETFLFLVAGGVIVFEQWRSRRKASTQREELDDRLDKLEAEREELKGTISKLQQDIEILRHGEKEEVKGDESNKKEPSKEAKKENTPTKKEAARK